MTDIIQFIPRAECDAKENLAGFVDMCRNHLTVFGADLAWDENSWDLSDFIPKPGQRARVSFIFCTFDDTGVKLGAAPMAQPFLDFAKGYVRYNFGLSKKGWYSGRMVALRALEKALVEASIDGIPRVEKADAHTFNRAAQLVMERYPVDPGTYGNNLKKIADFLAENRMTAAPLFWKNIIKARRDMNYRVGVQADDRRKAKLPSAAALSALPQAFHLAENSVDVVATAIAAILLCSPDRISEVYRLPVNCEHRDRKPNGDEIYGLRWWPSKGGEPMVKWITGSMVGVCQEAIRRLKAQTEEGRRIAKWYEENPGKIYLAPGLEYLSRQEYLSTEELAKLMGLASAQGAGRWASRNGVASQDKAEKRGVVFRFKDVEAAVLAMLPRRWPICDALTGLRYSQALLVFPKNFFAQNKSTYRCMFEQSSIGSFNDQLGAGSQYGKTSIFGRMGFTEPDGSPIKLTSHQFRHYLNTLAQRKNLSQISIALWSGRKDIQQNSAYDHVTAEETLELIRQADVSTAIGPLAETLPELPMSRAEFLELKYPTVHTTEYGFCVHDWSLFPCQKHRACIDCTEHLCVKGETEKTERVRASLVDAEAQLARDEAALAEGILGADRWFEHNRARVERLRNLLTILDDASVPLGTIIQLNNDQEYSPIGIAVDDRRQLGDIDAEMLNRVRALAQ